MGSNAGVHAGAGRVQLRMFVLAVLSCSLWCRAQDELLKVDDPAAYFDGIDRLNPDGQQAFLERVNRPWAAVIRLAETALAEALRAFPRDSVVSPMVAREATHTIPRGGVLDSCLRASFAVGGTPSYEPDCEAILCAIYDNVDPTVQPGLTLEDCFPVLGEFRQILKSITWYRKAHERDMRRSEKSAWRDAPIVLAPGEDWRAFIPASPPPVLEVPAERLPELCKRILEDRAIGPNLPPGAIDLVSADPKRRERALTNVVKTYNRLIQWLLDTYFPVDTKNRYKALKPWGREYAVLDNLRGMEITSNPTAWTVVVNRLWEAACWHYEPYDTRKLSGRSNRSAVGEHFPVLMWLRRHNEPSDETLLAEIAHPRDPVRGQLAAWLLCMTEPTHPGDGTFMTQLRIEWGRKLIDAYLVTNPGLSAEEKDRLQSARDHLADMAIPNDLDWLPPIPK